MNKYSHAHIDVTQKDGSTKLKLTPTTDSGFQTILNNDFSARRMKCSEFLTNYRLGIIWDGASVSEVRFGLSAFVSKIFAIIHPY